ncbi:zinc-ribbon domain-containing protein [Paraburkholderia edwinii]|uniref:Zinc-ribbon domain-containing protein n=1 Tax=Paraburkholderia edwinii TaxID=2861782 RepID=A0ABX8URH9_9BURK|nr:zinc-ribbon and DUF3426 domain-containing protein [Paraburkholderia edwinii]QYD69550.1 zinc-ribbon domain-containing protein [Paraburkholderia edwinii]
MALATRCPFCETVFRLQPAQLALRRGLVRCGHCREVFDASSSLFDLADGGDFRSATPVTADEVARLIAQEPRVSGGEGLGAAAVTGASASASPAASTASAASTVSNASAAERAEPVPPPAATATAAAAASFPAAPEAPAAPHAPFESASPEAHAPGSSDDPNSPDFRAETWNPWAPAPDASVDRRIRHNAATIPYNPVTIPRSAQPKLKLEFTEGQDLHLENATARPIEPAFRTPPEPVVPHLAAQPEPEAPRDPAVPPPHVWRRREEEARPEPALEPALEPDEDRTRIPPNISDNEPHFGPGPAAAAAAGPAAASPFAAAPGDDDNAFAVVREKRASEPRRLGLRIVGILVALVLFVVLIAQLAWWQRETVMVYAPGSRMLFAQVCEHLGCTFTPPRDIDGLQVEPSDLRQVDGPHKLELRMPLHNRFNVPLAYPAVELTLLDEHNNIAVRRVLWPQDYVKPGTQISAGLAPRTTETMFVRLDTGSATATNFRVQIFYP